MPFTRLRYHVTTATKARRRIIDSDVEAVLYSATRDAARALGGVLILGNGDEDHVHWLLAIPPSIAVSDFVGRLKARVSQVVREAFPELDFRWQKGFAAFTLNAHDISGASEYVRRQKEHHGAGRVDSRYEP